MKKNTAKKIIRKYSTKTEFWVGLITIFLFMGLIGMAFFRQKPKVISPVILANNITKPTPTIVPTVEPKLSQIKKLADTSGDLIIYAEPNDTFWHISVRYCGNGRYFSTIESLNGYRYRKLQPGDAIVVYCY